MACLAQHAEVRELRRGEAVRQQHGEEAAALIVVLRGEVVAWLPAAEGSEGAGARRGGGGSGSGGGSGGGGSGSGVGGGGGEAALCRFGAGERCSGFLELLEALVEGLRLSEAAAPAAAPAEPGAAEAEAGAGAAAAVARANSAAAAAFAATAGGSGGAAAGRAAPLALSAATESSVVQLGAAALRDLAANNRQLANALTEMARPHRSKKVPEGTAREGEGGGRVGLRKGWQGGARVGL